MILMKFALQICIQGPKGTGQEVLRDSTPGKMFESLRTGPHHFMDLCFSNLKPWKEILQIILALRSAVSRCCWGGVSRTEATLRQNGSNLVCPVALSAISWSLHTFHVCTRLWQESIDFAKSYDRIAFAVCIDFPKSRKGTEEHFAWVPLARRDGAMNCLEFCQSCIFRLPFCKLINEQIEAQLGAHKQVLWTAVH